MSKHPISFLDSTQDTYARGIKKIVHKVSTPAKSSGKYPNIPSGTVSGPTRTPIYFAPPPEPEGPAHTVTARHTYEDTIWHKNTTSDNDYRNFETCISADGELYYTKRGMMCNSSTFTAQTKQGHKGALDSVKYLAYHSEQFNVIGDEILYEVEMSACQVFEENRPIPREFIPRVQNIHQDYRLCCAASVLYDEVSMIGLYFLLTNDAIYAMYERRPGAKIPKARATPGDDYASFVASKFLLKRGRGHPKAEDILDDTYILAIGIDRISRCIRWYVNGIELWTVTQIGYRVEDQYMVLERGGNPVLVEMSQFSCGFGHFTFLDHQLPNNYSRELVKKDTSTEQGGKVYRSESGLVMLNYPETYREVLPDVYGRHLPIIPTGTFAITADSEPHRLFGQGVISCIKSMRVYNRSRSRTPYFIAPVRYTHEKLQKYSDDEDDVEQKNDGNHDDSSDEEDEQEVYGNAGKTSTNFVPPRQPFPILNVPIPMYVSRKQQPQSEPLERTETDIDTSTSTETETSTQTGTSSYDSTRDDGSIDITVTSSGNPDKTRTRYGKLRSIGTTVTLRQTSKNQ